MSLPRESQVACQGCGVTQPFVAWESLNVTLDPEEKRKLLSGDLNRFICEKCGWSGTVIYPLLYHDMAKELMLWCWPQDGQPDTSAVPLAGLMPGYRFRIVTSQNQLIEKVHIFDSALDDRVMEFLKLLLQAQTRNTGQPLSGELFFAAAQSDSGGTGGIEFAHLKGDGHESVTVPMESYQRIAESLVPKLSAVPAKPGQWLRIDRAYAETLVSQIT